MIIEMQVAQLEIRVLWPKLLQPIATITDHQLLTFNNLYLKVTISTIKVMPVEDDQFVGLISDRFLDLLLSFKIQSASLF